jgi:hypothetical protein
VVLRERFGAEVTPGDSDAEVAPKWEEADDPKVSSAKNETKLGELLLTIC